MGRRDANEPVIRYKAKNGKTVTLVQTVFLVNTKHPDGSPALCTQIGPKQSVDLAGGEEFMTGWVEYNMRPSGEVKGNA